MDPGDPPNPGIKPRSPAMQADSLLSELSGKAKNTGGGSLALLQGNFLTQESNQGIEHRFPALQADSLLSEPPGKPKNTGVGNLSILQWIFPTQELIRDLLHCRQILYPLNYEGSPGG